MDALNLCSDELCLLRAIRDNPWEMTPRLAYADLLEAQNEETRAAFIRESITDIYKARHDDNITYWKCPIPVAQIEFNRGFATRVTCMIESFMWVAHKLFTYQPLIMEVTISNRNPLQHWNYDYSWTERDTGNTRGFMQYTSSLPQELLQFNPKLLEHTGDRFRCYSELKQTVLRYGKEKSLLTCTGEKSLKATGSS